MSRPSVKRGTSSARHSPSSIGASRRDYSRPRRPVTSGTCSSASRPASPSPRSASSRTLPERGTGTRGRAPVHIAARLLVDAAARTARLGDQQDDQGQEHRGTESDPQPSTAVGALVHTWGLVHVESPFVSRLGPPPHALPLRNPWSRVVLPVRSAFLVTLVTSWARP